MIWRCLSYVGWAIFLLGVGALDLWIFFQAIGTFLAGLLVGTAIFYRHIINRYARLIQVRHNFIVLSLAILALNLIAGVSLNPLVDRRARDFVSRLEDYKVRHGEFPGSLLQVAVDSERQSLQRNRLMFGARIVYSSDGETFYLNYSRYPMGSWSWNFAGHTFQPALD